MNISSMPAVGIGPKPNENLAKIQDAARQFESLLIDQMLKSSRESGGAGWMGDEEEENSTLTDFGEQQFAQALAANGGLGIAKMIIAGLTQSK